MPLVAADTLSAGSDNPVILARGGHGQFGGHIDAAAAVTTMAGAGAVIAVGIDG